MSTNTILQPTQTKPLQVQLDKVVQNDIRKIVLDGTFTSKGGKQFSLLTVSKDLEIVGVNGARLDGQNNVAHLLFIADGVKVTIRGVCFTGGNTQIITERLNGVNQPKSRLNIFRYLDGGAISVGKGSEVVLEDCTFTNNHSAICGGAISNVGGYVYVKHCTFKNNSCGDTGAAIDNLAAGSLVIIEHCTFENNQANQLGNGNFGAVTAFPDTFLIIKQSDFSGEQETAIDYRDTTQIHIDTATKLNQKNPQAIVKNPIPNPKTKFAILSRFIRIFLRYPGLVKLESVSKCSEKIREKHQEIFEKTNIHVVQYNHEKCPYSARHQR